MGFVGPWNPRFNGPKRGNRREGGEGRGGEGRGGEAGLAGDKYGAILVCSNRVML